MNKVKQLIKNKGKRVWTVQKDATVLEAVKLMAEKRISSVLVLDGDDLAGIFTERDFTWKVGLREIRPSTITVAEVMTRDLLIVDPEDSIHECMETMTEKRIRHLPVLEDGKLVGIVSIGDVLKDIIEELRFMVKQLENYILGFR